MRPRISTVDTRRLKLPPKQADAHYSTPEHRMWRIAVLKRAGFRCQGISCGTGGVKLYADHIIEIKDGGAALDVANGQALCARCHGIKTASKRGERARPDPFIADMG